MSKKFIALLFCIIISSSYSVAKADGSFTWFGLKKDNTEIVFNSYPEQDKCNHHKCHHKKLKNKQKNKCDKQQKTCHKNHKFIWWCD